MHRRECRLRIPAVARLLAGMSGVGKHEPEMPATYTSAKRVRHDLLTVGEQLERLREPDVIRRPGGLVRTSEAVQGAVDVGEGPDAVLDHSLKLIEIVALRLCGHGWPPFSAEAPGLDDYGAGPGAAQA